MMLADIHARLCLDTFGVRILRVRRGRDGVRPREIIGKADIARAEGDHAALLGSVGGDYGPFVCMPQPITD